MTCYLAATLRSLPHPFLVIGYGNDLRSDDAIGPKIAETIADWNAPHVQSLAVPQLTPELAESLAKVEYAIFVDAGSLFSGAAVEVRSLNSPESAMPDDSASAVSHYCNPRSLLTLAQTVYGRAPQAWWVIVPGENFELGDRLSSRAEQGIAEALEAIEALIRQPSRPTYART